MEPNKKHNPLALYALVSQLLVMLLVLTIGGFLLGRYVFFKNSISGGIFAVIGAIVGIIIFIMEMLKIGKRDTKE